MPNGKPNILIIWGDDIGITNLSCYSDGLMGYRTPNIDRIAKEGMRFTDSYGQQSCTAGRAAFLTGQNPYRTGLTKVGLPGADIGLQAEDATIAELLKPLGYATGQFGKNHFGDRNKYLPTVHGFDEFLRQPLSPQRRRRAGKRRLSARSGVSELQEDVWAARRHSRVGDRGGRSDRASALGTGGQAEDRGHGPADQKADGDLRRRVCGGRPGLHQAEA